MVVLSAELEVAEEDGDFSTRNNEDGVHQKQETKDIVVLVHPHRCKNKVQLNKASSEWKNAANCEGEWDTHEPWLIWNLARDTTGIDWEFHSILFVSKVGTEKDKRSRNSKPEDQKNNHGSERDSVGTSLGNSQEVQHEEKDECNSWESQCRESSSTLPALSLEGLVHTCGDVTSNSSHHDIKEQLSHEQSATVGRAQESHGREDDSEERHA
mmetsp:Transcript_24368/g.40390  ORF Transcript_24368/g.40390 Transcript_24368/m.40390 type:complete len:212 (+) Transcript_24368:295-930(+)